MGEVYCTRCQKQLTLSDSIPVHTFRNRNKTWRCKDKDECERGYRECVMLRDALKIMTGRKPFRLL